MICNLLIVILALQIILLVVVCLTLAWFNKVRSQKENEYYTDYRHGNLVIRIYKPEFEYQAIGSVPRDNLLDRGNFSQFYIWALIDTSGLKE